MNLFAIRAYFWLGMAVLMVLAVACVFGASGWFAAHGDWGPATWFGILTLLMWKAPDEMLANARQATEEMRQYWGLSQPDRSTKQ